MSLFCFCKQKIGYHFKKPEIDWAIANRINKLFMFVIARFPSDLKLWLSQIEFCKRMVSLFFLKYVQACDIQKTFPHRNGQAASVAYLFAF